ncbi:AAA family ATPase [Methylobacterium platani]|uniref:ATP-binding protein n=2 Tax=Methylobacterium platani TaxID=427683 RepID=A0A179S2V3_9HYPH|nr:AAA family ATPase [Methylobacterium platani]KMO21282.1 ATP-binding protein [Methylobacterium platani JCM 14648]OAS18775.1 ATP-binding protein [Methylobacterium platani]
MPIHRLAVSGYRSLRDTVLGLDRLTVVTGANGSGKSSLYRALRLLAEVAQGRAVASLAREGGFASALWAGPETFGRRVLSGAHRVEGTVRRNPVELKLGFSGDDVGYAIALGLPAPSYEGTFFAHDPEIKAESVWTGPTIGRANVFAERRGPLVRLRDGTGAWTETLRDLAPFDSLMTHGADPRDALDVLRLRERMRAWRFYDHFRTDRDAPARRPQIGTRMPVLAGDGADVAAAIRTIQEIGDHAALDTTIAEAFPGSTLAVAASDGQFSLELRQHGLLRPLRGPELSDGTLRYILLAAALLSPRPPDLMVLNEPETSLHADLLAPLASLVARAAESTQVLVVSHAAPLVAALERQGAARITLEKRLGETLAPDHDPPSWAWPKR